MNNTTIVIFGIIFVTIVMIIIIFSTNNKVIKNENFRPVVNDLIAKDMGLTSLVDSLRKVKGDININLPVTQSENDYLQALAETNNGISSEQMNLIIGQVARVTPRNM